MSYLDVIDVSDVRTLDDVIEFARSRYGVVVHWKEKAKFKKLWQSFKKDNPHVDVSILAHAISWGKSAGRKLKTLSGVFYMVADAHQAGALPQLDPHYGAAVSLDDEIYEILAIEKDDAWRTRLICAEGPAKERAIQEWRASRAVA